MSYIELSEGTRAQGGEVTTGQGLVGEPGPEAIMPQGVVIGIDLASEPDRCVQLTPCPACYTSRHRAGCGVCDGSRTVMVDV